MEKDLDLRRIWERQEDNQRHWPIVDLERALIEFTNGIFEEGVELQNALGLFKQNLKENDLDVEAALLQCVDVAKYVIAVCLALKITPEQFQEAFFKKSDVVDIRWASQNIETGKPIIILDLDDVLASYTTEFDRYVLEWCRARSISTPMEKDAESAKKDFRMIGGYSLLKPVPGAVCGFKQLKEWFHIGILTARPVGDYSRIYTDTLSWLKKYDMVPDFILWDRDKVQALSRLKCAPMLVVDDSKKHVFDLAAMDFNILWFGQDEYVPSYGNAWDKIAMVRHWSDVIYHTKALLNEDNKKEGKLNE